MLNAFIIVISDYYVRLFIEAEKFQLSGIYF